MYQPPNNEVLIMARFFGARQSKRPLHEYLQKYFQEMRSLLAIFVVGSVPEHVKVATFMKRLKDCPARQTFFRKVPSTMEQAIEAATVEKLSFNSASALAFYKPTTTKSAATPMELGSADVVCFNCGKRGHMMAPCYANAGVNARAPIQKTPLPKGSTLR